MVFLLICKSSLDNKDINHLCITIVYTFSFAFPAQFLHLGLTYNGFRCTEIEILCNQAYQSFHWWFLPWFLCLESSPLSKFQFQWNNHLHFLLLVLQPCYHLLSLVPFFSTCVEFIVGMAWGKYFCDFWWPLLSDFSPNTTVKITHSFPVHLYKIHCESSCFEVQFEL